MKINFTLKIIGQQFHHIKKNSLFFFQSSVFSFAQWPLDFVVNVIFKRKTKTNGKEMRFTKRKTLQIIPCLFPFDLLTIGNSCVCVYVVYVLSCN